MYCLTTRAKGVQCSSNIYRIQGWQLRLVALTNKEDEKWSKLSSWVGY